MKDGTGNFSAEQAGGGSFDGESLGAWRSGGAAFDGAEFDVVIVGAGLGGLQCARLCAREGLRVLLVERKRTLAEGVHTTGIFVRRTLEDFPLPADCLGPAVRHVTLYSPARRALPLESPRAEFRVGRMARLYARFLSECLQAGAAWSPATRYLGCGTGTVGATGTDQETKTGGEIGTSDETKTRRSISRAKNDVTNKDNAPIRNDTASKGNAPIRNDVVSKEGATSIESTTTVVRLETGGRAWSVRARFLVGADGAQSRVARDLGLDENREWIVGVEEVYEGARAAGPPRFHCFLDPRLAPGYLAWVVADGEETHVGVGGYAARFDPARALETFRAGLGRIVDLSGARRVERRGGRIPVGGVLERIACARGLLVGDAAGAVSPLTAGGLDPTLRLSALAARVIADYLATGDAAALAPYSGARFRTRFRTRLLMRRALRTARSRAALEAACALLRLPPFRTLARRVFFGRGSFPDVGPVAKTVPAHAHAVVPSD